MSADINFIYFDVGGVAILDFSKTNKWQEMMEDLHVTGESKQHIFIEHFRKAEADLCTGKKTSDQVLDAIISDTGIQLPLGYSALDDFVNRFEKNDGMSELIADVSNKYRVGLLTNMFTGMLDKIKQAELLPQVEWGTIVDSSIVGVRKPEEAIYMHAESTAGVAASEIFFIDNAPENIEAAHKRGWQTFLYDPGAAAESNAQLQKYLSELS